MVTSEVAEEWSRARSRKNGPSTRSLRSLAQDIRLACIWPKAMSEPAGRQASRMAGGGPVPRLLHDSSGVRSGGINIRLVIALLLHVC